MKSKILFALVFALPFTQLESQIVTRQYTVSGYVVEAVSGESLSGVNIFTADRKTGTVS